MLLFTKVFPIISIWEIREGRENAVAGRIGKDQELPSGDRIGSEGSRGQGVKEKLTLSRRRVSM